MTWPAPTRRWPAPADAADLARGGLRERLRAAGAADLLLGVHLAAALALLTATALAAAWSVLELRPPAPEFRMPTFGPFTSLGAVVWPAWLVAAVTHAFAPARYARRLLALAVLLTALVVPAAAVTGLPRPTLLALVPQLALGLLALALPDRLPWWARLAPLPVAALAAGWALASGLHLSYHLAGVPDAAAAALVLVALLLALGLAVRGDTRGGWAFLLLLTPAGLLSVRKLAQLGVGRNPEWPALAGTAAVVVLLGTGLMLLTVAVRRTRPLPETTAASCPTCGTSR